MLGYSKHPDPKHLTKITWQVDVVTKSWKNYNNTTQLPLVLLHNLLS